MSTENLSALKPIYNQIRQHLFSGIVPFWLENGIDKEYGGYLTCFDQDGFPTQDTDKYIVTQSRMIWGFSALTRLYPNLGNVKEAADQGAAFFIEHFWDRQYGGWFWKTGRNGAPLDNGKVVYGQSFAIYALAEHALATGNAVSFEYAAKTFDLLQKFCADTRYGGYYENMEKDWTPSEPGFAAGDRKSLDIHMHLMEAFTTLAQLSAEEVHRKKLQQIIDLILERMVDTANGCGYNQFDLAFNPIPAIDIRRTWNAERFTGEAIDKPTETTSYGHNVELAWLLNKASDILGNPRGTYDIITKRLVDHALKFGFDWIKGGVYRDGLHNGMPLVKDKEWWQNAEVLVGFFDAYERLGDHRYLDAFMKTWEFDSQYFINDSIGEWHQLLDCEGNVLCGDIGNPWKAIYHTGRAMMECEIRLRNMGLAE